MPRISKRMKANFAAVPAGPQDPDSAVKALKRFKAVKFDQTVNVVLNLGIDPKQADQLVRGSISLPHGIGKRARVICFCNPDKVAMAKEAGAIEAGGDDLVQRIEGGWFDFDVAIASPDMMRTVSRLGKVLGPKGLMPSPKAGTVTPDIASAVREYSAGKQEYRNDDGGNVHGVLGRLSFPENALTENLKAFVDAIQKARPAAAKGVYVRKCVISGCMTAGVQVTV